MRSVRHPLCLPRRAIVNGKITNFYQRSDTDGNVINASDGGVIFADGQYHWYGLRLRPCPFAPKGEGGQVTDTGVVMYASSDLVSWKYEGVILACSQEENNPLRAPMRFERPKIIYNQATKKYVLWCHYVKYPGDHGFGTGVPTKVMNRLALSASRNPRPRRINTYASVLHFLGQR